MRVMVSEVPSMYGILAAIMCGLLELSFGLT